MVYIMASYVNLNIMYCILVLSFIGLSYAEDNTVDTDESVSTNEPANEDVEYLKGSICSYCSYCKFCQLCDKECPCEKSLKKPNCDMCKYCKYCPVCKLCSYCQPGSFLDKASSAIITQAQRLIPSFDKEEADKDIKRMDTWIDQLKDEL